jgi:hypothetical protein
MNEFATPNETYVARYQEQEDPYAAFANESGSMIVGKLLTCKKGAWTVGRDEDAVPAGTRMLALVPSLMRGMVKWVGGSIVDAKMGLVKDGFLVPHRYTLGDLDEDQWEKAPNGEPRDPWARSFVMQLGAIASARRRDVLGRKLGGVPGTQRAMRQVQLGCPHTV